MAHRLFRAAVSAAAGLALAVTGTVLAPAFAGPPGPALTEAEAAPEVVGVARANAAGVPAPDATDAEWHAWSEASRAEAHATDWAAASAARGCTLVSVSVTDVALTEVNVRAGAPGDLLTPVVDRVEDCAASSATLSADRGERRTTAVSHGAACRSTSGPGTACISRSGSYVVASFSYRGSGSVSGYMRIYQIPSSSYGCPTGTTLRTGAVQGYTYGTQRSISVTAFQAGGYSAHFWRHVGWGSYTDWGSACGVL